MDVPGPRGKNKVTHVLTAQGEDGCPRASAKKRGSLGYSGVMNWADSAPSGKPYLVKHPESRVREAGQNVTFCCKASGTPMPKKYSW